MSDSAGIIVEPVKSCRAAIAPFAFPVLCLRLVSISSMVFGIINSKYRLRFSRTVVEILRSFWTSHTDPCRRFL